MVHVTAASVLVWQWWPGSYIGAFRDSSSRVAEQEGTQTDAWWESKPPALRRQPTPSGVGNPILCVFPLTVQWPDLRTAARFCSETLSGGRVLSCMRDRTELFSEEWVQGEDRHWVYRLGLLEGIYTHVDGEEHETGCLVTLPWLLCPLPFRFCASQSAQKITDLLRGPQRNPTLTTSWSKTLSRSLMVLSPNWVNLPGPW